MSDNIKMYDYLMNEYNKSVDLDNDEMVVAYGRMCYIVAQAYLKKIKEYC